MTPYVYIWRPAYGVEWHAQDVTYVHFFVHWRSYKFIRSHCVILLRVVLCHSLYMYLKSSDTEAYLQYLAWKQWHRGSLFTTEGISLHRHVQNVQSVASTKLPESRWKYTSGFPSNDEGCECVHITTKLLPVFRSFCSL